jgi:hypothetical protein
MWGVAVFTMISIFTALHEKLNEKTRTAWFIITGVWFAVSVLLNLIF